MKLVLQKRGILRRPVIALGIKEVLKPALVYRTRGHPYYLLIYFHDNAEVRLNGKMKKVSAGSLVLWPPKVLHEYGNQKKNWSHSWLGFRLKGIGDSLKHFGLPEQECISFKEGELIDRQLWDIHREVIENEEPEALILSNLVQNLLLSIARKIQKKTEPNQAPEDLIACKFYLDSHPEKNFSLAELASHVHRSIPWLCIRFKEYYGEGVIQYAIRRRMELAAYMLGDHNKSIGEIGYEVGYDDIYQFSRMFKKHTGKSPRAYRKK